MQTYGDRHACRLMLINMCPGGQDSGAPAFSLPSPSPSHHAPCFLLLIVYYHGAKSALRVRNLGSKCGQDSGALAFSLPSPSSSRHAPCFLLSIVYYHGAKKCLARTKLGIRAGLVGPPGFSLPLTVQAPGSGTSTINHLQWREELGEFHEPWYEQRE